MSSKLYIYNMFRNEGIDLEWLERHFNGLNPYSNRGYVFVESVWHEDYWDLTEKQRDWVDKILEDCTELKIEERL